MLELGSTEHGCLLLADITGYTEYIGQTEITHAQDVIADLIETIVEVITPTFEISRIEGDAAFAFAEAGTVNPTILMDTVDSTYFAFRRRVRDVANATSCPCQACIRIPALDLKFFLHEGEYAIRQVAGFKELSGIDVIVLFRLAKGTASSVVNDHGYAVYTGALLDAMGFEPSSIGLIPHREEFADTGPVAVFVQDLEDRWRAELDTTEVLLHPANAAHQASIDTAAPPQLVWDYLTDPQKRLAWQTNVTELILTSPGRQQTGSVNHCMHGSDVTIEQIADWRPFGHLTLRYDMAGVKDWLWMYRLDRLETGTRVTLLLDDPGPEHWEQIRTDMTAHVNGVVAKFGQVVDQAWANG